MTARTHDAFALAFLVTVAAYAPPESLNLMTLFTGVIGNNIGALIPDMDSAGNRLWDLLPAGDQVGKIFRRIFYKHRTLSHSLLGAFVIYKLLSIVLPKLFNPSFVDPQVILFSVMIGYVSHLLADSMTKEGLPLLFPFKFDFGIPPIKAIRITTGKRLENFLVYPGIWAYLILFIYLNQEKLIKVIKLVT